MFQSSRNAFLGSLQVHLVSGVLNRSYAGCVLFVLQFSHLSFFLSSHHLHVRESVGDNSDQGSFALLGKPSVKNSNDRMFQRFQIVEWSLKTFVRPLIGSFSSLAGKWRTQPVPRYSRESRKPLRFREIVCNHRTQIKHNQKTA